MSRGLGRIERTILASIASSKRMAISRTKVIEAATPGGVVQSDVLKDDASSVHITPWMLAHECFEPRPHERGWAPSRSQIKVCTRAIHSIARKFPQYAITPGRGRTGIVLYEIGDPVSVLRAKMQTETDSPIYRGKWNLSHNRLGRDDEPGDDLTSFFQQIGRGGNRINFFDERVDKPTDN